MTSRDFVYWLQGYFELSGTKEIGLEKVSIIRNHLNMVFKHEIDPNMGDSMQQNILDQLHQNQSKADGTGLTYRC